MVPLFWDGFFFQRRDATLFAVLVWGDSAGFSESADKVVHIPKTALVGDLGDGQSGGLQQLLGRST